MKCILTVRKKMVFRDVVCAALRGVIGAIGVRIEKMRNGERRKIPEKMGFA